MLSWRRSANLIPCAGKAAGDEETDDGVHNSGCHSHSRKKCGACRGRAAYRNYGELISSTRKAISIAVFLAALGACSSQVTVHDLSIPDPLVEKIPISIAVKFPAVFEHFVHEERVIDKKKWTLDVGRSNALLFTELFRAMFNDHPLVGYRSKNRIMNISDELLRMIKREAQ